MEGWERAIVGALTTSLTVFIISLILQNVRDIAAQRGKQRLLEYGPRLKWLVVLGWIGTIAILVFVLFSPTGSVDLAVFTAALLGPIVGILHLEFYRVRIAYDSDGIHTRSAWRWPRTSPWNDVQKAWYSRAMQWYVIQTANQGRVRLHDFLDGRESLINELRRRGVPVRRKP